MKRGVFLMFTDCTDPARHDEFNRWYRNVHIPDLESATGFLGAKRFVNARQGIGQPQYVTAYEFEGDPAAFMADTRRLGDEARKQGRSIDCIAGPIRTTYVEIDPSEYPPLDKTYPPITGVSYDDWGSEGAAPAKTLSKARLFVFSNCGEPDREDEYNSWYTHMHLPDLSAAQGFIHATRFRHADPANDPSTYVAVYEFEHQDLWGSLRDFFRTAQKAFAAGRQIECLVGKGGYFMLEIDESAYPPS